MSFRLRPCPTTTFRGSSPTSACPASSTCTSTSCPSRCCRKVWAYFDQAKVHYGMEWPVHYRTPEAERVATLQKLGVRTFAPLVYPHKPGMARWLTEWVTEFAAATPDAVPTATLYPEPDVADYLGAAVEAGARAVKVHVQVGAFDPRDPLLRAGVGTARRCGRARRRPLRQRSAPRGAHRARRVRRGAGRASAAAGGAGARRHARLRRRAGPGAPLRAGAHRHHDGRHARSACGRHRCRPIGPPVSSEVADRVVFGSDFPNIPYAVRGAGARPSPAGRRPTTGSAPAFLRSVLHDTPSRLLAL